jgi:IclR family acetate operon transcriptional repressor
MRNDVRETEAANAGDVGVLVKALDVLEALARGDAMSVAEVATSSNVNRAATYRILATLERRGYVLRLPDDVRRYSLGPALRALVRGAASPGDVLTAARPLLREVWEEFGETVNLGVFSQGRVLYLDILESGQGLRTTVTVGTHDELHSTALGKAMLAVLPPGEVRELLTAAPLSRKTASTLTSLASVLEDVELTRVRGYALDDEENEPGARCVAAAIVDRAGRPVGAVSVSGPTWRIDDATVVKSGERLCEVARAISEQL